ncbi:MAG: DUF58 domain-containing protein, partial [Flavobacteriaceae bacterium]
ALLSDSETGKQIWVNTSDRRWQKNFKENQIKKEQKTKEIFDSASAGFISLKTGDEYVKELRKYFKK